MLLPRQTWVLVKKDLTILVRRRWLGTLIRALLFPVVFTFVLSYIKYWTRTPGLYGIGKPSPVLPLGDALAQTGSTRPNVVIITNGLTSGDVGDVIANLSTTIKNSGKQLYTLDDNTQLRAMCPSSSTGVTSCFAAVEFMSSPDHPAPWGDNWNYTLYFDGSIGENINVNVENNDNQLYSMPFKHAVDLAISTTHGGDPLPPVMQYPYTATSEEDKEKNDERRYQELVAELLAFAFFVALVDLTYYCVGHICRQRELGITALVDAMLPNHYRWEALLVRNLATHIAFDIVYLPGWIIMGIMIGVFEFSNTGAGWFVLLYILTGLALTSYCILASSLFRKAQLSAISSCVLAIVLAMVAQFGEGLNPLGTQQGVLATAFLFPPAAFVYFLIDAAGYQQYSTPLDINKPGPLLATWSTSAATFLGFLAIQIVLYPIIGVAIEWTLHTTYSSARIVTQDTKNAVVLDGFSKKYKSLTDKKQTVQAVNDLSLSIPAGAITVLLGANGCGKTTTLKAIAGLETITSGTITVDGTGGIGICPQQNIYWEDLTVEEHISLLERLKTAQPKSRADHKAEVERLIIGCDLDVKRHARAKTLSGGQKRKLQLAMMLAGGSRVCCIDEASSGIDPLARRKIWEILLRERGTRTLLLTTHFLDEAEVLSDLVAIMSQGALKAEGSVATLKSRLGNGYRVTFDEERDTSTLPQTADVTYRSDYNKTIAQLPTSSALAVYMAAVQDKAITGYRITGPTIESIFLSLAEEMSASTGLAQDLRPGEAGNSDSDDPTHIPVGPSLDLDTGTGSSPWKQTRILLWKRLIVLRHNFWPYVGALFIPLTLAGIVTLFFGPLSEPNGNPCADPDAQLSEDYTYYLESYSVSYNELVYGPPSILPKLEPTIQNYTSYGYFEPVDWTGVPKVSSFGDFQSYIAANLTNVYFGGLFVQDDAITIAWPAPATGQTAQVFLQGMANSVVTGKNITTGIQLFEDFFEAPDGITVLVAVITVLGFSIYPCLFALYPTAERIRNVRAMHYSNGILSSSLWLAYLIFDFVFVLIISAITVAIWSAKWTGWYAIGYMFVVFLLFGLASTAFSYVVSLFAGSQLAAMGITMLLQSVASMLYFIGYIISEANAPLTQVYTWFNYITFTVGLVSPSSNLMRALFMTLNNFALDCKGKSLASYPGDIEIYGQPILYLTLQFVLLSAFLMFWESGRSLEVFGIKKRAKQPHDMEKTVSSTNPDAAEDPSRLAASNNGLRLSHVSKSFGKVQAVDDVTFGILPSEKFALIGPNGAGKSTTISLIRGEMRPSATRGVQQSITVGGDDLARAPVAAKNHLGVCPQFDSTDSMTLREHLQFYARARGVPHKERNIDELLRRLGLEEHAHKMASKLSGGTRRKLSLAIALVANPRVLLLDEPSSGMDPAAKRALWRTLAAVAAGRVLLLTTHSMEEADALCERVGIMAGRMLALGPTAELRDRFGRSVGVHLVHGSAPWTSEQDMARMREWALGRWPDAEIERSAFGGQLRFNVPRSASAEGDALMGQLFPAIEEAKAELGVVDYAIGPATLDQVFLNVVGRHDVREENTDAGRRFSPSALFGGLGGLLGKV